jgi:AcrR family transcriptional regulator
MARLSHLTERGLETQRLLGEVLFQLIAEKDYGKISVKDITARAQVDRTTFYLHFQSKDDLLAKTLQQVLDDLIAFGKASHRPYPLATVAFEHMAQHLDSYRVMLKLEGNSLLATQLQQHLEEILLPWLADILPERQARNQTERRLLVAFILGAVRGAANWWLQAGMPLPPEEMGRRVAQLLREGISHSQP